MSLSSEKDADGLNGGIPRVLSIQSHVVHGYVGNKCAVLPLNRFGFDVDAINSVHFSNHTGYPSFAGQVMSGEQLKHVLDGLDENGLLRYSHLLTGYIGSLSLLEEIASTVQRLRKVNPDLVYVCDPVQGDDGRFYCRPELPDAFRNIIVPLASVLTPNQFEAETLTGMKIKNIKDAAAVCNALHNFGPHTVVLTSTLLPGTENEVTVIASTNQVQDEDRPQKLVLRIPRVHAYFTGTGDLFTALLLAWLYKSPRDLQHALEMAVSGLQAVLRNTVKACGFDATSDESSSEVWASRELRLIQNQDQLLSPTIIYQAEPLKI